MKLVCVCMYMWVWMCGCMYGEVVDPWCECVDWRSVRWWWFGCCVVLRVECVGRVGCGVKGRCEICEVGV